jgi:ketosteroid isomerase-like protein
MATKSSAATDEAQIRQRIESWATALRAKDLEQLMSHYTQDILVFALAPGR